MPYFELRKYFTDIGLTEEIGKNAQIKANNIVNILASFTENFSDLKVSYIIRSTEAPGIGDRYYDHTFRSNNQSFVTF